MTDDVKRGARRAGEIPFQFYSKALNVESTERLSLETALRGALDRGELVLYTCRSLSVSPQEGWNDLIRSKRERQTGSPSASGLSGLANRSATRSSPPELAPAP